MLALHLAEAAQQPTMLTIKLDRLDLLELARTV